MACRLPESSATTVAGVESEDPGKPAVGTDPADRTLLQKVRHTLWRLVVTTVGSCLKHRVTGLAAEGAFFAVLSVPPLIFALIGGVGYVSDNFSAAQIEDIREAVIELFS